MEAVPAMTATTNLLLIAYFAGVLAAVVRAHATTDKAQVALAVAPQMLTVLGIAMETVIQQYMYHLHLVTRVALALALAELMLVLKLRVLHQLVPLLGPTIIIIFV